MGRTARAPSGLLLHICTRQPREACSVVMPRRGQPSGSRCVDREKEGPREGGVAYGAWRCQGVGTGGTCLQLGAVTGACACG